MFRFYFRNVGRRCGVLMCSRRGWLPVVFRESAGLNLWVSCGHHREAL